MFSIQTISCLRTRYFLILLWCLCSISIFGQLNLTFSGVFPNNTIWIGNTTQFIHNSQEQLQLNASAAGESTLFTRYKVPPDSIQFDIYFKMLFAPSNDNFCKIYLFIDNTSEINANGYYLRLGENGNNDAIQLWKLTNGSSKMLGSGRMGGVSLDPADGRIQIKIYRNGLWLFNTDYDGGQLFEEDFEVMDTGFALPDSTFFGLYCKYTSTRTDKFFFDDIFVKTIPKDTIAPNIESITVLNPNQMVVTFSEKIEESSATTTSNYVVNNSLGSPDKATFNRSLPNQVYLNYSKPILSGINYTLDVKGIKDHSGNQKNNSFTFLYAVKPMLGDLIITEVLTDPYSGGDDFMEVYNTSSKFLSLDSIQIGNSQKNENKIIRTNQILKQGQYVALSKNISFLKNTYFPPDTAIFIEATLPSFNVDMANVSVQSWINGHYVTLDSFDYEVSMHFELIDVTKGVSLERINLKGSTNDKNNWHSSSAQNKFATPGYKNSSITDVTGNGDEGIFPDKKVFTPNGDGITDFVLLTYKFEKPGYLATLKIFDTEGFAIRDVTNNFLLGTEGVIKWDGTDGEGNIVRTGMYIIISRLFHPDGSIKNYKSVVVAADTF